MKTVDFDILRANMGFSLRPCSRSSCHETVTFLGVPNLELAVSSAKSAVLFLGPKLDARLCLKGMFARVFFLARHRHSNMAAWQHGKRLEAKDGPMRHVVGVLGTPEAMLLYTNMCIYIYDLHDCCMKIPLQFPSSCLV